MFETVKNHVANTNTIVVIQAENPDGDSLGSALALEEIFSELGKKVILYCPVAIPKYLRYTQGWDRVTDEFPRTFDISIIVDTASKTLLGRALEPANLSQISAKPCIVLDHHITQSDLDFTAEVISDPTCVATGELIYKLSVANNWPLTAMACEQLAISIMADSLGLVTENTTAETIHTVANLVAGGAKLSAIDNRRREFMKKAPEILTYKGQLLQRIEYYLDGALALIHIPWDEIATYSDKYNPSMLVLDEMRLVEGVRVTVALKTYPDTRITGKIRCNPDAKIAETIAGFFGGGGHPYVAGFRTYSDDYQSVKTELIATVDKILAEYDQAARASD